MARRSFLRACGGSAALLLPLLRDIEARASGAAAPLRFLVIQKPLGVQWPLWRPAAHTATTTDFTLPVCSAPFEPLRSKMAMIDGLTIVTTKTAGGDGGNFSAEGGMVALMTGQPALGKYGQQDWCAGGASIDQIFLDRSPVLGGRAAATRTAIGSLQLAADIRSDRDEVAPRVLSYRDPLANEPDITRARQPLYPELQPLAAFNRLFGGALPPGTTPGDTARLLAQKLSVLDFMRKDLARLQTLIPATEKVRLAVHADAIQRLEATIRASLPMDPTGVCATPATPPSFTPVKAGPPLSTSTFTTLPGFDHYTPNEPDNHPHETVGRLHLALIKAAFACDLTRVATFLWASGTSWVSFPGNLDGADLRLRGATTVASAPHHPPSHSQDPDLRDWLAKIDGWYARQTSLALQEFEAQRDADGNSLLDNTVAAYVSEGGDCLQHDQTNIPFLVFGGKNTRIRGGRFIKATGGSLPSTPDQMSTNRPTNDVWLALAPIFGVDLPTLGAPTQFTGPLPELVAP
jgi:hypothetical protein